MTRGTWDFWPYAPPMRRGTIPTVALDDGSVNTLTRAECIRLLGSARTGRLGFHANALPMLLPLDFAVDEGAVVLRVRAGSQADRATRDAVVAFQTDGVDPVDGRRWSVSVTGMATHVSQPSAVTRARALLLEDAGSDDDRFVRVSLDVLLGRRALV